MNLKEKLADALKSHDGTFKVRGCEGIYDLLGGAAIAIAEALNLLNGLGGPFNSYQRSPLPDEFQQFLKQEEKAKWNPTQNFNIYYTGFFLNKAQSNLAAALDRTVNRWVTLYMDPEDDKPPDEQSLYGAYIDHRLLFLRQFLREPKRKQARADVDALRAGIKKYGDTHDAGTKVHGLGGSKAHHDWDNDSVKLVELLIKNFEVEKRELKPVECVAVVWGHVNFYKHGLEGGRGMFGIIYPLEIALTLAAFLWVSWFCKQMVDDVLSKRIPEPQLTRGTL